MLIDNGFGKILYTEVMDKNETHTKTKTKSATESGFDHNLQRQYKDNGFVVIRNLLSKQQLAQISFHVDRIFQQWFEQHEATIYREKMLNMHSLTHSRYFKDRDTERVDFFSAILPETLTQKLDDLFSVPLYFHNSQLFFNPTNSERQPYWHRDLQYSDLSELEQQRELANMLSLHVRIPLVDEKGVELIPGTHKRWDSERERNVRLQINGHRNTEQLPNALLTEVNCGDVLVFNAQMLHRGAYKHNKQRKALDLCIGEAHPLLSEFVDK
ncbi:phytanoyl-CoA dioxygenase family protein [Thalassotalea sp. HSM 43]|uniref:phytanoyl-CoA dioxygenase family protein n=1 Tax=Thalassotalea sp. HSM 43 TaxID=2552945 RepID=UPI001E55D144|nr:phytanoyl-CoA dioxygenase family protein [Thalassotalea sp. HSM 43]